MEHRYDSWEIIVPDDAPFTVRRIQVCDEDFVHWFWNTVGAWDECLYKYRISIKSEYANTTSVINTELMFNDPYESGEGDALGTSDIPYPVSLTINPPARLLMHDNDDVVMEKEPMLHPCTQW